jgi:hypothetical protein
VKHGNRAITSKCGGADVLEELGVRIDLPPADLRRRVEAHGLGFIFAPAYHPAFKAIVPVRKALAARGIPDHFQSARSIAESGAASASARRHFLAAAASKILRGTRGAGSRAGLGGAWQRHG